MESFKQISRLFFAIAFLFLLVKQGHTQTVNERDAEKVARNFLAEQWPEAAPTLKLKNVLAKSDGDEKLYYVVNFHPGYFVMVSAEQMAMPILGFSNKGYFGEGKENPQFAYFMESVNSNIKHVKQGLTS